MIVKPFFLAAFLGKKKDAESETEQKIFYAPKTRNEKQGQGASRNIKMDRVVIDAGERDEDPTYKANAGSQKKRFPRQVT